MRFRGIYAPLTTPFDHSGAIYWTKFDYNLARLARTKLSGFLVGDAWGEGPLLTGEEKIRLWKRAGEQVGKSRTVLVAVAGCGVAEAREQVAAAAERQCAAAVLEVPDLAGVASQPRTAELFFRAVADTASIPILARARLDGPDALSAERLAAVARHPRIAGLLVAGANAEAVRGLKAASEEGASVLVWGLEAVVPGLTAGAAAAVLPTAAAVPFFLLSIEEAVRTREVEAANELARRATPFANLLRQHGAPALKCALDLRSGFGGAPRLPLLRVSPDIAAEIRDALDELAS